MYGWLKVLAVNRAGHPADFEFHARLIGFNPLWLKVP